MMCLCSLIDGVKKCSLQSCVSLPSQTVLNELMHKVAHDREFLTKTLAQTIKVDDFTGRLFQIFEKVWDEGLAQVMTQV